MNIQIETITLKDGSKMDVIRDIEAVRRMTNAMRELQKDKARLDRLDAETTSICAYRDSQKMFDTYLPISGNKTKIRSAIDYMKIQSCTPRTDALRDSINADCLTDAFSTWLDFARQLERELADAKLPSVEHVQAIYKIEQLKAELERAKPALARQTWVEAGGLVSYYQNYSGNYWVAWKDDVAAYRGKTFAEAVDRVIAKEKGKA